MVKHMTVNHEIIKVAMFKAVKMTAFFVVTPFNQGYMNNEIKVSLNVILPGRVMLSQESADALEKSNQHGYESFSMVISDFDKKTKKVVKERITAKVRKCIPAAQSINISVDAYKAMTSNSEVPYWTTSKKWGAMKPKERLEAHLQRICEGLGGLSYSYKVLD